MKKLEEIKAELKKYKEEVKKRKTDWDRIRKKERKEKGWI